MKNRFRWSVLFCFIILMPFNAFANSPVVLEDARKTLLNEYNYLQSLEGAQWQHLIEDLSAILEDQNKVFEAEVINSMKDPAIRTEIAAILKEKIDNLAANGIFYVLVTNGGEEPLCFYIPRWECRLRILLSIATLSDDEVAQEF